MESGNFWRLAASFGVPGLALLIFYQLFKEVIVGLAEVRDVFKSPKIGAIAGCMVVEGGVGKVSE